MSAEHRRFQRILAQRFGGCMVRLDVPPIGNATLTDISVGGMKILIAAPLSDKETQVGAAVRGVVHNENPAFDLAFEGHIAWSKQSVLAGDVATAVGVQFADYTSLPDALMNLVEVYDA
ncbi:MAG: PilZ domain-containing protein [Turneriella sp.]